MNQNKLKKILNVLSDVDDKTQESFKVFDDGVNKLKQDLKEKIQIKTLDEVNSKLDSFGKKIDLEPLQKSIETLNENFKNEVDNLLSQLDEKTAKLEKFTNEKSNISKNNIDTLTEEISNLRGNLKDLISENNNKLEKLRKELTDSDSVTDKELIKTTNSLNEKIDTGVNNLTKQISDTNSSVSELTKEIPNLRSELLTKIRESGSIKSMNRKMSVNGVDALLKYTDVNYIGSITKANNDLLKRTDITFNSGAGFSFLTQNQIAYGGPGNIMTSDANFTYNPTTKAYNLLLTNGTTFTVQNELNSSHALMSYENLSNGIVSNVIANSSANLTNSDANGAATYISTVQVGAGGIFLENYSLTNSISTHFIVGDESVELQNIGTTNIGDVANSNVWYINPTTKNSGLNMNFMGGSYQIAASSSSMLFDWRDSTNYSDISMSSGSLIIQAGDVNGTIFNATTNFGFTAISTDFHDETLGFHATTTNSGSEIRNEFYDQATTFSALIDLSAISTTQSYTDYPNQRQSAFTLSSTGADFGWSDNINGINAFVNVLASGSALSYQDSVATMGFFASTDSTIMGEFLGSVNKTTIQLTDSNGNIIMSTAYNQNGSSQVTTFDSTWATDGSVGRTIIGDINGSKNGTTLMVDDVNTSYTFNGLAGNGVQMVTIDNNGNLGITDINPTVNTTNYSSTVSIGAGFQRTSFTFTGGTGASAVNINAAADVGSIVTISDGDFICSTSNITTDVGAGNTLTTPFGIAQTFVMRQDGLSITIQKFSSLQWMMI